MQEGGSFIVVFMLFEVLAAVQLNHQFLARGAEIDDEVANGVLPAETNAVNVWIT
ncbi:MAG: hypothetical protein R6W69_09810 [Anaerolineales bacterium]